MLNQMMHEQLGKQNSPSSPVPCHATLMGLVFYLKRVPIFSRRTLSRRFSLYGKRYVVCLPDDYGLRVQCGLTALLLSPSLPELLHCMAPETHSAYRQDKGKGGEQMTSSIVLLSNRQLLVFNPVTPKNSCWRTLMQKMKGYLIFFYVLQKFYNIATLDRDGSTICLCTYTHAVKSTKGSFARRIANKAL